MIADKDENKSSETASGDTSAGRQDSTSGELVGSSLRAAYAEISRRAAELQTELYDANEGNASLSQLLGEAEATVARLETELRVVSAEREAALVQQVDVRTSRDSLIDMLHRQQEDNLALTENLAVRVREIGTLRKETKKYAGELKAIRRSTSWRITEPLRRFVRLVKRRR